MRTVLEWPQSHKISKHYKYEPQQVKILIPQMINKLLENGIILHFLLILFQVSDF